MLSQFACKNLTCDSICEVVSRTGLDRNKSVTKCTDYNRSLPRFHDLKKLFFFLYDYEYIILTVILVHYDSVIEEFLQKRYGMLLVLII